MRPSSLKKKQNYLDVATELFLEQGFDATGLDQLIERCGGSKLTLYNYFGDKRGLLKEVVTRLTGELQTMLALDSDRNHSTEQQLQHFCRSYTAFVYHPKTMGLFRLMIAQSKQDSELIEYFLDRGPRRALAILEQLLVQLVADGQLQLTDPHNSAEQLLGALRGSRYFEALLTPQPSDSAQLQRYADRVVDTFLRSCH
ncbi:DNA-binding transcriptional regulator, AcrR family [Ferrimonas sediminum]|uniref:DNA-binding transcriptional regulator, AcrR family n=1 Tax=Ferrimonas sediminum TaxID=718193 RepID=A0A1G8YDN8_9GAMM|nr:TetR/AcrR family transcriptional regulator [Ferrimonas sediminum]SDK00170.1 DNA-binding transcriptional regulator, AcrR family [Ferrimonas sediminum]